MKKLLLLTVLILPGCANMKPVDMCIKTGVLMDLVKLDICGKVGDGKFDPEIDVEKADAVD